MRRIRVLGGTCWVPNVSAFAETLYQTFSLHRRQGCNTPGDGESHLQGGVSPPAAGPAAVAPPPSVCAGAV
jgi:hypothetical protein